MKNAICLVFAALMILLAFPPGFSDAKIFNGRIRSFVANHIPRPLQAVKQWRASRGSSCGSATVKQSLTVQPQAAAPRPSPPAISMNANGRSYRMQCDGNSCRWVDVGPAVSR